jgi:hypothetical protein
MPIWTVYRALQQIAQREFADIVLDAQVLTLPTGDAHKLRLDILDGSLLDVFISTSGRYSYHWERRLTPAGDLYRHDNAPHKKWRNVTTFPRHFHNGGEDLVVASHISDNPHQAIREFLTFVRRKLVERS